MASTAREFYLDYMKADIMLTPDTRVLEIGCGEGGNLLPFAEKGCNIESPYKKDFMLYIKPHTMGEREHTLAELTKMEQVRNYLIDNQAIDADGFVDFLSELQ